MFYTISFIIIIIVLYLLFVTFTEERFYSSAIVSLFLFQHNKWKLYIDAKKQGVKKYLTVKQFQEDVDNKNVPDYYLYPIENVDGNGGIKYILYTKGNKYVTGNFYLTHKL